MKALIEISLDKAAFADAPHQELNFIPRQLASNVAGGAGERQLYDSNATLVGFVAPWKALKHERPPAHRKRSAAIHRY
jgi:hypothetical protein